MKAFPNSRYLDSSDNGMDLRDYFAAKVMQYWMTYPMTSSIHIENMCKGAYHIADEMIKAREQK